MECNTFQEFVHQGLIDRSIRLKRPSDLKSLYLELVGEVGEAANALKHTTWWPDGKDTESHVVEELGDILWYIFAVCDSMDLKVEDILKSNMEKLAKRYPSLG